MIDSAFKERLGQTNVPKAYRALAELVGDRSPSEYAARCKGDLERQVVYYRYATMAKEFAAASAPTYVLSHSIAAALTATRSPVIPFAHCPYPAFFIEVPSEFLPLPSHRDVVPGAVKHWISVLATDELRVVALHARGFGSILDLTAGINSFAEPIREEWLLGHAAAIHQVLFEMRLGIRLASNVIAYVTSHRNNVVERTRRSDLGSDVRLLDVNAPCEVVIDREFRDRVRQLVAARTIPRARGVLVHLVRGHWRSVPGTESLIWIAPYRRGDDNIGRVVERTERL